MSAACKILVKQHDEICKVLDASPSTLTSLTGKCFAQELIDSQTKREIFRINGYRGASLLLDHVQLKMKSNPRRLEKFLKALEEVEPLRDIKKKILKSSANWQPKDEITTQNIHNLSSTSSSASTIAKELNSMFGDLLANTNVAIKGADVSTLRLRIMWFFKSDDYSQYAHDEHLYSKLDSCKTAEELLLYLVKVDLIGYLNYNLLKEFAKASGNDPDLKSFFEKYEQKYLELFQCDFPSIIEVLRNPSLTAHIPPVGLPEFTVRLGAKWDTSNLYTLQQVFINRFSWAEDLLILEITKKCVLIKYGVLPFFVPAVMRDLSDPKIIEELKKEDIIIGSFKMQVKDMTMDTIKGGGTYNNTLLWGIAIFMLLLAFIITNGWWARNQHATEVGKVAECENKRKACENKRKACEDKIGQWKDLQDEYNKLQRELDAVKKDHEHCQLEKERWMTDASQKSVKIEEQNTIRLRSNAEISTLEKENVVLKEKHQYCSQGLDQCVKERSETKLQLEEKKNELWQSQLECIKNGTLLDVKTESSKKDLAKIDDFEKRLQDQAEMLGSIKEERKIVEAKNEELEKKIKNEKHRVDTQFLENESLRQNLHDIRMELQQTKADKQRLQKTLDEKTKQCKGWLSS